MKTLCVVHLARASNGLEPFRAFLASYLAHDAGAPHRLLVVFKGFGDPAALAGHDRLLEGVPHERLLVRDFGFDIRPYFVAARRTRHDLYCFLNSFSVVLDDGWLAKLARHMGADGRDLVAATGSWISHANILLGEPDTGRYLQVGARKVRLPFPLSALARAKWLRDARRDFDPFPNYHVRTNAFLVSRDAFLACRPGRLLLKIDAFRFESGREGLSARIKARQGRLLVVGRDGRGYAEREWAASRTFWQGEQENLLVADNQTELYAAAAPERRAALSRLAWGDQARPGPAGAAGPAAGDEERTRRA